MKTALLFACAATLLPLDTSAVLTDEVSMKVQISNADKSDYNGPATVVLSSGDKAIQVIKADATAGLLHWSGSLEDGFIDNGVSLEAFPGHITRYVELDSQVFASAEEGRAGFVDGVNFSQDSQGTYTSQVDVIFSTPPVFGSCSLDNQNIGSATTLLVRVFDHREHYKLRPVWINELAPHLRKDLPSGLTGIDLYTWAKTNALSVAVVGSDGSPLLANTLLRRTATIPLTIPPEAVTAFVIAPSFDNHANWFFLVEPEFHEPNPSNPNGSEVSFETQRRRATAKFKRRDFTASFSRSIKTRTTDLVLEAWSVQPNGNGNGVTRQLRSSVAVNSSQLGGTVDLN